LYTFEANIRFYVETILTQDIMSNTKIVVITPPPINIPITHISKASQEEIQELNERKKQERGYKTYLSKKKYAERVMQIAEEYKETGRVVGLDFWGDLVKARLQEDGKIFDEELLPGSGLCGALDFGEISDGYFTDGLHLGTKAYTILSNALYEKVLTHWPDLAPERL
jgi:lysophospholipase L1-like esterase